MLQNLKRNSFAFFILLYVVWQNQALIRCLPLQIKLSSVQLARKYMKRVASELDAMSGPEKEPNREFILLQGVRFAFRVHQVYWIFALVDAVW
jgi:hypothetical protein